MKRWVLAATILGSAMAFIDTTVVNVALPVMQRDLRATVSGTQWSPVQDDSFIRSRAPQVTLEA